MDQTNESPVPQEAPSDILARVLSEPLSKVSDAELLRRMSELGSERALLCDEAARVWRLRLRMNSPTEEDKVLGANIDPSLTLPLRADLAVSPDGVSARELAEKIYDHLEVNDDINRWHKLTILPMIEEVVLGHPVTQASNYLYGNDVKELNDIIASLVAVSPVERKSAHGKLVQLAAAMLMDREGTFLSTDAEDHPVPLKLSEVIQTAGRQREQLRLWAIQIRESADRLFASAVSPEWQPIETAPEMRTVILWADTSHDGVSNWHMGTGFYHREMKVWIWEGEQVRGWAFPPTHWRPLPDSPLLVSPSQTKEGE